MKLLFIVLNSSEKLEEALEGLIEAGVTGATVVDSVGMGHIMEGVPLFAGMRSLFGSARPRNNTIFSVLEDSQAQDAMAMMEKILGTGPGRQRGAGCAFILPVERVTGIG